MLATVRSANGNQVRFEARWYHTDGNPFYDDFFEKYEGRNIAVEGFDMGQYFLVSDIKTPG